MDCLFIGQHIIELPSVDSTNIYLTDLSQSVNLPEGTLVDANEQISGKGQRNKSWQSEAGKSLCISILLKPKMDLNQQFSFNKFIALSLCQALNRYGVGAKIKWPNDILVGNKKLSGILIENTIRARKIEKSIVGIGVNICNNLDNLAEATSLEQCLEQCPSKDEVLASICQTIEKNYLLFKRDSPQINALYHDNLFKRGESQLFEKGNTVFDATIESVNANGQLIIEIEGGKSSFNMGEIVFKL